MSPIPIFTRGRDRVLTDRAGVDEDRGDAGVIGRDADPGAAFAGRVGTHVTIDEPHALGVEDVHAPALGRRIALDPTSLDVPVAADVQAAADFGLVVGDDAVDDRVAVAL